MNEQSKFPDQSIFGYTNLEEYDPIFAKGILENPKPQTKPNPRCNRKVWA
jgi:hypothetical protein